ncbi:hypothetical protein DSL72_008193 [Monilinia vaccinii-corymbosi]|uniref:Uncharacterized protein n=1 Tax=Monilinia vaccinii-corymbosi TaxID=61207 RepID=A0A8A3PK23_9HELO|nr:hypothetical protein DSL72_008193 [Monilinia vaccinii-corymbosi]
MPDISRNRIEIWRNEVESQTSSQSGLTGEVGWNASVVRPPSFWGRIFGLGYGGCGGGSGSGSGSGSGNGGGSGSGSGGCASIRRRLGLVKGGTERTGMYTVRGRDKDDVGRAKGKGASGERDGESSMELDGSEESGREWLRDRKNGGTGEGGRRG